MCGIIGVIDPHKNIKYDNAELNHMQIASKTNERLEQLIENQHFPSKFSKFEVNYYIFD